MAKILIVEDDPLMARLYQKAFAFEGYQVDVAYDGEEGLRKVQAQGGAPTMVLLDIMMPKLNGLQVLDSLKANAATKTIPVVVLTNLAGEHDAEAALMKGAVKYIVKSHHEPKEVVDMVKQIIAGYTRNEVPKAPAN